VEAAQIDKYLNILTKWHKKHRLVGSVEPAWLIENVILDSLCFLAPLPSGVNSIADVGSGAGVPGIPLAIVRPDLTMSLIEARQRRASFLSTVVRELGLGSVDVVCGRVEGLGQSYEHRFDAAVMRCAAEVGAILGSAFRLVRPGGAVVLSSNPKAPVPPGGEVLLVRTGSGTSRTFIRFAAPEVRR